MYVQYRLDFIGKRKPETLLDLNELDLDVTTMYLGREGESFIGEIVEDLKMTRKSHTFRHVV